MFELLEQPHFNIRQTGKEILLYCLNNGMELKPWEVEKIAAINRCPNVSLPILVEGMLQEGRQFVPSKYQSELLHKLYDYQSSDEVTKKLYTRILRLGWDARSGMSREGEVHRQHNINTNFDTIEINGPYFQVVQEAMNLMFSQEIREQVYDDDFIQEVKTRFRLYDPTDVFITVQRRPELVDWIASTISDEAFLSYEDAVKTFRRFMNRDEQWITLYEDGHQRIGERYGLSNQRTCYFQVIAFLIPPADCPTELAKAVLELAPYGSSENQYRFEIPHVFPPSDTFPIPGIRPILGISKNRFRGQDELSIASLLPDLIVELGLSRSAVSSLNYEWHGETVVQFVEWQEAFDQGRRRQKPRSAGVLLKIRKDILQSYLEDKHLTVRYVVYMKRSTDKYSPEEEMDWKYFEQAHQLEV